MLDAKLKDFVKQIREKKGELFDLICDIKRYVNEPMSITIEKRRPTFTSELKDRWEIAENLMILVNMYHAGLIDLQFQSSNMEFLKQQFQTIGKVKNQVLLWMHSEIQKEREWQQSIVETTEGIQIN